MPTRMLKKSKLKKFWRSLTGKPTPIKKRSRTKKIRKNNTLYSSYRGAAPTLTKRRKRLTEFEKGRQIAISCLSLYNSQTNRAPGYIDDTRIHHGEIGAVSFVAGVMTNDELLTGFGTELMIDDIHDAPEWFTFKKRNYSQYGFI
jgi:hypothetical protein